MITLSTGLQNHLAVTGSLKSALEGCVLRIYSGFTPSHPNNGISGGDTLLVSITLAPDGLQFEEAAVSGVLLKKASQEWAGTVAATGTAAFFRISPSSDTGSGSSTEVRMQGSVGMLGADLELANVDLESGAPFTISSAAITIPMSAAQ